MKFWHTKIFKVACLTGAIAIGTGFNSDALAQSGDLETFRQQALTTHNTLRQEHDSAALTLDGDLNDLAQDWAQQLAVAGKMRHRPNNKYGENIYYSWSSRPNHDVNGMTPVQSWYDEVKKYNFNEPGFSMQTGHFTQVVWINSRKIGCGKAKSQDGKVFVVCNYDPPGNFRGQFPQNVRPAR